MMRVKWLDISFGKEEIENIKNALSYGDISGFSPIVDEFEELCRDYVGCKYALACSNGTAALIVSFLAIKKILKKEIKIGLPAWTYIAPANAASLVGEPIFYDSDLKTHNMKTDYDDIVDVICPVDMAGVPAEYDKLRTWGLPIISDGAESFGSLYKNKKVGNLADITTTSFQSAKVIITGEGGMIFTDKREIMEHCKNIINQGYGPKGYTEHSHIAEGYNFRLSALNAAVGIAQLKRIDKYLEIRKTTAKIYDEINNSIIEKHNIPDHINSNFYSYLIMVKDKTNRDNLKKYLISKGIETKLWSPVFIHKPYQYITKSFTNVNYIYNHHLRLPIHNNMTKNQALYVADMINNYKPI